VRFHWKVERGVNEVGAFALGAFTELRFVIKTLADGRERDLRWMTAALSRFAANCP